MLLRDTRRARQGRLSLRNFCQAGIGRSIIYMGVSIQNGRRKGCAIAVIEAIGIPDTHLCKQVTELVRDTEPELLFNHSSRVYYFGALTGLRRGLRFDRELLYMARCSTIWA